ncbi:MAG: ABC transporter permease [Planctomycetota bacterium]|jgi:ABC-2 type transport system permease protein
MNIKRTVSMVTRDLRLGRRSPIFMGVVIMPLVIAFLSRLDPLPDMRPRLGVVDRGRSEISSTLASMEDIRLTVMEREDELRKLVRNGELDGGLVLEDGFDAKVRAKERPTLQFFISGESFPSKRILLAVTALDLVRNVEGRPAPLDVTVNRVGDGRMLPFREMRVLFLTTVVLSMAGIFLPALSLVEERERGTLSAMLVTPAKMSEVLLSKAVLGLLMAIPTSYLTLVLTSALPAEPRTVLVTLAVAAVICVATGLVFGTIARDSQEVFALMESLGILFMCTLLLAMGSSWSQLIAKIIPIYWFILPLFKIAVLGAGMADIWGNLMVGLGMAAVMAVATVFLGRRMQAKLACA